jgi:hypothetical protein
MHLKSLSNKLNIPDRLDQLALRHLITTNNRFSFRKVRARSVNLNLALRK